MAGVDIAVFDAILKDEYLPPIRDQVNRATVLLDILEKKDVMVEGRQFIVPLITAQHKGVVSRSGASKLANKLPTAQSQTYNKATYDMFYHYGRIEVDGPSMRASDSDRGAFTQSLDAEVQGLSTAMSQDLNRQLWGDGSNRLATPSTTALTTVVPVDDTRFLHEGMTVTWLVDATGVSDATANNAAGKRLISTVDSATQITMSVDPAETTAATSLGIYSEGDTQTSNQVFSSWMNATNGLKNIINNVNDADPAKKVGNITRSTTGAWWDGNVLNNSGTNRPLTIGLMQQALLKSQNNRYGGKVPNYAICDADIWSTYGNLIISDKRYRGETMTLDGGWQYLDFSGCKVIWDKDATANLIYWFNTDHLFFLSQSDLQWMDEDGAILSRVTDYDSYEAVMYMDKELGTDCPAAHTLLDDLATNLS